MKKATRALTSAAIIGFGIVATFASATAGEERSGIGALPAPAYGWGLGYGSYGSGPIYSGEYAPLAGDSYVFSYEYPVYAGGDVTAVAVDLINSRFRHRRVTGPGIVFYRGEFPRPYRMNPYW